MPMHLTRRTFLGAAGLGLAALGTAGAAQKDGELIQGFEQEALPENARKDWAPVSDRMIRVGIVGYGVCQFGSAFGFQDHPNVEVVAVSDLFPDRCAALAKECRCGKTYESLEELVKDDTIEAVFVATDAPSHARHCIEVLNHGKHVATCVPAAWGSLEEAEHLFEVVKNSDRTYMMFETSSFHQDLYAMRQIYNAGLFGKIIYSEGEYYHYMPVPIDSYKGWRIGNPPQWYPTHSNAYHIGITDGSFTEVTCQGMPSVIDFLKPENNAYKNPFGTEVALFRTNDGGMSRMAVSWDTPAEITAGERGRIRGQKAAFDGQFDPSTVDPKVELPDIRRPALPPNVDPGGHGGSHGFLMNEFVTAILEERKPLVDISVALNMTVPGIVAHQSALKDGETMKIPQYAWPKSGANKA
ncbi:MAG: Gfo/Idh/MocA family oxidoreductase [Candidatus Hydrogenedentes bacterium]|nr:Gfo/Idh/MocA family oxidoreductase [Candidatus Hydrogenedentota bacterium]